MRGTRRKPSGMKPATNLEILWVTEFDYHFGYFLYVHILLLVVFQKVNTGCGRIQYHQLLRFDFPPDQFEGGLKRCQIVFVF